MRGDEVREEKEKEVYIANKRFYSSKFYSNKRYDSCSVLRIFRKKMTIPFLSYVRAYLGFSGPRGAAPSQH
jgi:hypothetical protein